MDEDYVAILPPVPPDGLGNTSYQRPVILASHGNIARLNGSLEEMVTADTLSYSIDLSQLQDALMSMLTAPRNGTNHLPCTKVLIAIIEEDIERSLQELLIQASEANPGLRVFFFSVAPNTNRAGEEMLSWQNVESLVCRIGAVVEHSDVDVLAITIRAEKVQRYLNYLPSAGKDCSGSCVIILKQWPSDICSSDQNSRGVEIL